MTGRGAVSPKSNIEITSAMTRRSDSGAEKMTGTSIDFPKLDSLEPGPRPFYNKIGEVGRRWETVGGKSEKNHGRLISTQYFYFSNKNDFKKLSAAPTYDGSLAHALAVAANNACAAVTYLHTPSDPEDWKTEFFTQPDDDPPDEPSPNCAGAASSSQEDNISAIAGTPSSGANYQAVSAKVTNVSTSCSVSFHL